MSRFILILSICISYIFLNINLAYAQEEQQTVTTTTTTTPAGATVVKKEIVTTTPAPKEVIAPPSGYASCFIVKGGWYQDVWVAEHNVCSYSNSPSGLVWIEGYWTCDKYDATQGQCTNWNWKSGHWEKTVTVY